MNAEIDPAMRSTFAALMAQVQWAWDMGRFREFRRLLEGAGRLSCPGVRVGMVAAPKPIGNW